MSELSEDEENAEEKAARRDRAKAWAVQEVENVKRELMGGRTKHTMQRSPFTAAMVSRRAGMSYNLLNKFINGEGVTVERWWSIRKALNINVSGHASYEDWAFEFGVKLRRLCRGRFASVDDASNATGIPKHELGFAFVGGFKVLSKFAYLCESFGIQPPIWKRHEDADIAGYLDDKLTSPPLDEISIPRGLLRWRGTVDHVRVWLTMDKRDTPRGIAALLGLPAGYVSSILTELERDGLVVGDSRRQGEYIRRYERVKTFAEVRDV